MPTLQQMEAELGYSVDQDIRLREAGQLFYADLTLFYSNIYDRARKEYQNLHKPKISDHHEDVEAVLNTVDEKMVWLNPFMWHVGLIGRQVNIIGIRLNNRQPNAFYRLLSVFC